MLALGIWGRQLVYQMVLSWLVQVPPDRSATEAALAYGLSAFVTVTMVA